MDSERNRITRRDFVAGLGALVTTQIFLPSLLGGTLLRNDLKPLRFVFLTDCHAMQDHHAPEWLDQTAALVNSLKPDLVIGGGDFVDGGFYLPGKLMETRWKLADSFLRKIRTRLEPMIGNHDFYDPLQSDGTPSKGDPRWRFKNQFGLNTTYRSFEVRGYRFLILDSVKVTGGADSYCGWIDASQLDWLDRELMTIPQNQPIILCTHIPFKTSLKFAFGSLVASSPGRVHVLNSSRVMEKLRSRPLAVILQGHLHVNERLSLDGIPCITGGAVCGNWWKGPNMGTYPGVGVIELVPQRGSGSSSRTDLKQGDKSVAWRYINTPSPQVA